MKIWNRPSAFWAESKLKGISPVDVKAALNTRDAQNLLKGSDATTNERGTLHEGQLAQKGTASSWSKHQRHWPTLVYSPERALFQHLDQSLLFP